MKRLLLLVIGLVVTLMSVNVMAQNVGAITVYVDVAGTNCEFVGQPAGFIQIYYFHEFHNGVTGSQFRLLHTGTNWSWFANGTSSPAVLIIGGDPDFGFSWAYGACRAGRFYMGNSLYQVPGTADPCATIEVVPAPLSLSGTIEGIDCSATKFVADGWILTMNDPDTDCDCGIVVPVKSSSWGQIKALYGTTN